MGKKRVNINTKLFNEIITLALGMSNEAQQQLLLQTTKIHDWDISRDASSKSKVDTVYQSDKPHPDSVYCHFLIPIMKDLGQLDDTHKVAWLMAMSKLFPEVDITDEYEVNVTIHLKHSSLERRLVEQYPKADFQQAVILADKFYGEFSDEYAIMLKK